LPCANAPFDAPIPKATISASDAILFNIEILPS
jgi:hypothetical protein